MSRPRRSVCLIWCLWALPLVASQLPRAEQERVWNAYIRDKPNPWILDDLSVLESGENLPFSVYKEAIDKRIPVLMERTVRKRNSLLPDFTPDKSYVICLGYLVVEGREYLAVLDCAAVPFEKRPPHLTQKTLESDHPAVKSYVARALKRRITADYETGTGKLLSPGVSVRPFRDASSCRDRSPTRHVGQHPRLGRRPRAAKHGMGGDQGISTLRW